ncbi:unnamed protein product [Brassica rapa]|uniref:Uncharacterized protein n=1 Tax=Brassica campestris TaxID=3711 RepID=A0A3P5ZQ33_BRACM|nr:unnamed protein product [Brassica rapa]VDC82766.1 unnamed protein product [Brassica rapa]
MANVANDGIMAEVNRMLEEMFLLETGVSILFLILWVSCPWVTQRLAAGDRLSVRVFLRRINGTLTPAEENEMVRLFIFSLKQYGRCMVSRIVREPLTLVNNHTRFLCE